MKKKNNKKEESRTFADLDQAGSGAIETAEKAGEEKTTPIKKRYSLRFYMMILSGGVTVAGFVMFALYFMSLNMVMGVPGTVLLVAGILVFRHYWQKEDLLTVEQIGGVSVEDANSLNLYEDKVEFANVYDPKGFPQLCKNLKKRFYVNIWDGAKLVPFVLPDQQYYDPMVFAQRVLGLPAHKKIFERKPKLLEKLKTAMLVAAIGIVWLLILTTTGEA